MKYENKKFSVMLGGKMYSENWEKTFKKPKTFKKTKKLKKPKES